MSDVDLAQVTLQQYKETGVLVWNQDMTLQYVLEGRYLML